MVNAGICTSSVVSYMENEAHGPENLGFIRKDAYDYLSRLKRHTKVENGDASELVKHFSTGSNNESFFYWNVQLDDDNRVMNFFFRDYLCRIDYEYFGDVLSVDTTYKTNRYDLICAPFVGINHHKQDVMFGLAFMSDETQESFEWLFETFLESMSVDTTYKTNRYDLICAPFVGINHHKQNVMFGLAFMSDETQESFEWLFETFLESMSGKQPETVFTDQCQAMMNTIGKVFPSAHHRLCQWHINQNAPSHLGNLNCDSRFKAFWYKCMNYCDSEEEFEATWTKMIHEYNLSDHSWLNGMYKLRHKWAKAFNNHKFSVGLLATSSSEGTNSVLKKAGIMAQTRSSPDSSPRPTQRRRLDFTESGLGPENEGINQAPSHIPPGGDGVDGDNIVGDVPSPLTDETVDCEDIDEDGTFTLNEVEAEQQQERPKRVLKKSKYQKTPHTEPAPTK
ncbi:hypothetical protein BUALT_Bualt14G0022000 [Buddleja alternifolia]|uniref:Protein FAR1-RELATED SEQUENCE n=1 Tax=Buddleja alternifolia TaxID=168488 RepID=A0AAV6WHG9_9LAMI|nr:hypothetical protein BUALT_Bualt14G0022000 [Buddleja alternifolia]